MLMKAQRGRRYQEDTLVVGIDIAKQSHVAVAEGPGGIATKPLTFSNSHKGFQSLDAWLVEVSAKFGTAALVIGFEPTGHYWKPLAEHLGHLGYELRLVSPVLTKRAKDMLDGSPLKTDAKDARVIADLVRQGKSRPLGIQTEVFQELRYLAEFRGRLVAERTALLNRLHRLLDLLFPELPSLFATLDGAAIRALLHQAPTPREVKGLGQEGLANLLAGASRGRLGKAKAESVMRAAETSIACQHGNTALRLELTLLLPRLDELVTMRAQVEKQMAEALAKVDYAKKLLDIPGLGPVTVAVLLGDLGDLRNFQNSRQVLKMAGLNLFERSSGQQRGQKRISKRGRSQARQALYLATLRMFKKGGALRGLHTKMSPTKPGPKMAVAGMRRLLKAIFAVVRDNRAFSQEVFEVRPAMVSGQKLAA